MEFSDQKSRARNLRKRGVSLRNIAKEIGASASSVRSWCKDIQLTASQLSKLNSSHYGNRGKYLEKLKNETSLKVKLLRKDGMKEVGKINQRELFLIGVALYWSEGFKKDSQVGFANSDPAMIKLFIRWLYDCFDYKPEDLLPRLTLNISHKDRTEKVISYWSEVIDIPRENFRKPFYQNVKWKKIYDNPENYYGVLRIKVRRSKDFLRKIHGFIEGLRLEAVIR